MPNRLSLPDPGEIAVYRQFISPSMCEVSVGDIRHAYELEKFTSGGERLIKQRTDRSLEWGDAFMGSYTDAELHNKSHNARRKIHDDIVSSIDFTWNDIFGFLRVMSRRRNGISAIYPHRDQSSDVRVLVDPTGGAKWTFTDRLHQLKYPDGLYLNQGDVVLMNNQCPPEEQLEHGVEVLPTSRMRASYLFVFMGCEKIESGGTEK